MEQQHFIYQKLEAFIRKFYINELIRGTIFFIGLGFLYLLFILFIEYFLWLKPTGRSILFWTFVVVEIYFLFRFIVFAVFKLFKLKKGINYNQASIIIGNHFTEVSDKLINFLQLSNPDSSPEQSELLLASIDQKANILQPIPFGNAINFKSNHKYFPLALLPVLLFMVFYWSGNTAIISQSLNRVVHYNAVFLPPAPFKFTILNTNLHTEQGKDFILKIKTEGRIVPDQVLVYLDGEPYYMESVKPSEFEFKIEKPSKNLPFYLQANAVSSPAYELQVLAVPLIAALEMQLTFPSYLNRKQEIIKGTGNASIPEGTYVTWKLTTQATQKADWTVGSRSVPFSKTQNSFVLSQSIIQDTDYQIATSNDVVKHYEKLNYALLVIKDKYPVINVSPAADSLRDSGNYLIGQISDDYGLSKLQVVYYPKEKPTAIKRAALGIKNNLFDQFVFSFPNNLPVAQGVLYEYYFEVFDTDALHHFKRSRSTVFSNRVLTQEENQDQILQQQAENQNNLERSLKNQDKQISEIEKLQKMGKEKANLDFKEQQKVNDFIKRQIKQDEMMREFTKKMNDNLDKFKSDSKDKFKEDLKSRMDYAEKELEKNKKLLEELQDLNNKIQNEEFLSKLETYKQNTKNQNKTVEQLVALTKKFYVEKKAEQLAKKVASLSKKQEQVANTEKENTLGKQEEINKEFDKIKESLNDLEKDNRELKSPLELPNNPKNEQAITQELKKAFEELSKDQKEKAKSSQKSAAKKMKEMAQKMKENIQGADIEQLQEDVVMLRQVLDNLLAFSFSQEALLNQFKKHKTGSPAFNKNIKVQQDLKLQFKHVDDSLFAMSLRNPKIAEDITKQIGIVVYNLDQSLSNFTDAQIPKGVSHQQYTVAGANKLADFLSEVLTSLQMEISGKSAGDPKPGKGEGMQLPDIMKKQESITEKIKQGIKENEKKAGNNKVDAGKTNKSNKDSDGEDAEGEAIKIMEIYKEQIKLREALESQLKENGFGAKQLALEQMKQIEKDLINKGFKNETVQRTVNLKQELLKLSTALQEQGLENKRESESNKKEFSNPTAPLPTPLLEYLKSIEILNRQSLPLRSNFNQKVQEYFNKK